MYKVKEMIFISPLRKNLLKYGVYVAFTTLALITFSVPHFLMNANYQLATKESARFSTDLKYVLFWKPSPKKGFQYPKMHQLPSGQSVFIKQKCQYINCYLSYNKQLLRKDHQNFDAVVFNVHDIANLRLKDLNLTRSSNQRYIFHSLESAAKYPVCNSDFDGFFNWTWTYKLNSDVTQPFFNIYDENNKLVGPKKHIKWIAKMTHKDRFKKKILSKNKAVALVLYKCNTKTKYEEYIKELKEELHSYNYTLDLYGPCGNKKCPSDNIFNCYKLIEKNYFFQLILEDTVAEDYVTDKVVKAMTHLTIPIVLGGSHYESFFPPGSFINSASFDMKKLGAIIDYLIRNPQTYELFFDWKNHYYYTPKSRTYLCDLCLQLNLKSNMSAHKSYNNFRQWWNLDYKDHCRKLLLEHFFVSGE